MGEEESRAITFRNKFPIINEIYIYIPIKLILKRNGMFGKTQ